jgi:Fe-S oxidoreductase
MHIEKHLDVINACRFCFMCRHLDPVGNVTFREADTPRGRALVCDRIRMDKADLGNPDFIDTLYRSALSAANRFHCVSHYDETGLVLAARRDIAEAGLAPERAKALAETLEKADFTVSGKGDTLYFGDHPELYPGAATLEARDSARSGFVVPASAGSAPCSQTDPGAALLALGFAAGSEQVLARFKRAVAATGCKTLVVAEPSAYSFLKDSLPGVEVTHSAEYLLAAGVKTGRTRKAVYLESDFLKNYDGNPSAPRDLLQALGFALQPFGTNGEESYAVGEGAVVYDTLYPDICAKLCARVYALAADLGDTLFVTASRTVRDTLKKHNPAFNIVTLEDTIPAQQS